MIGRWRIHSRLKFTRVIEKNLEFFYDPLGKGPVWACGQWTTSTLVKYIFNSEVTRDVVAFKFPVDLAKHVPSYHPLPHSP